MTEENCYVVSDETKEAIVIDDGALYDKEHQVLDDYVKDEGLRLTRMINTHGHFDHTLGCFHIFSKYGIKPEFHHDDVALYENLSLQIQYIIGQNLPAQIAPLGNTLKEGNIICFGNTKLKVIETPGHTPGGICFYSENDGVLFSGDSLFELSIGRTDFPGGNYNDLVHNLKTKILTLPESACVYPGHGATTTIGREKKNNPFLQ